MTKNESTQYRHDIDGLRGVAILAVVLYHGGFPFFRGGFVGVDVFFVISGYFIAASLISSLRKPDFSLGDFYRRRAERIVPPLFVMAVCGVLAAYWLFPPQDFRQLGKTLMSVAVFCSNLFFHSQGGYFDAPLEGNPFLHTWFLSIQGQFYILFPLFLLLVRRRRKDGMALCIGLLLALSFGVSVLATRYAPQAAYFFLSSRGWELLAGALLAVWRRRAHAGEGRRLSAGLSEALALLALAAIVVPIPLYSPQTPFPGLAAVPPCLGAVLLIWLPTVSDRLPAASRLLCLRPLLFAGTVSYSLYLWHWPVFVFMKDFMLRSRLPLRFALAGIAASLLIAWASWHFLERPIRGGGASGGAGGGRRKALLQPGLLLALFAVGAAVYALDGLPGRLPAGAAPYVGALDELRDAVKYAPCQINDPNREGLDRVRRGDLCLLGDAEADGPLFFSWGDSHMDHFRPLLRKIAGELSIFGMHLPTPGRLPLLGVYREYYDTPSQKRYSMEIEAAAVELVRERRIPVVLLSGNWPGAESDLRAVLPDGGIASGYAALAAAAEKTVVAFEEAGAEVWIVKSTPIFAISVPRRLIRDLRAGADPAAFFLPLAEHRRRAEGAEAVFRQLAERHPNVRFIDPADTLCADGERCLASAEGGALYFDSNHLTEFGALFLEPGFREFTDAMREKAGSRRGK